MLQQVSTMSTSPRHCGIHADRSIAAESATVAEAYVSEMGNRWIPSMLTIHQPLYALFRALQAGHARATLLHATKESLARHIAH